MDYWVECIAEAFEESKITATKEQIDNVASWAEGAHDNYSLACGYDAIPNPLLSENEELKRKLKKETEKVHCKECGGSGSITAGGSVRSSTSQCCKCRGEGRFSL